MSHLACADEKDHFMNAHQIENFKHLKEKYFKDTPASLSASDGAFLGSDFCFDMVRLGAAMYGINTAPYRPNQMQNIITLKAPVLQVTPLKKGDFVGYSATYRAKKPSYQGHSNQNQQDGYKPNYPHLQVPSLRSQWISFRTEGIWFQHHQWQQS